jgi:hypothetical protein
LINWLSDFRYDYPRLFWVVVMSCAVGAFAAGFISLASTSAGSALGITQVRDRGVSLYHAAFWFARAQLNDEGFANVERTTYGNLLGLDKDGLLIIKFADGRRFVKKTVKLADVRLTDPRGVCCAGQHSAFRKRKV